MLQKFSFFLSVALVTAVPQASNQVRQDNNEIRQVVKNSLLNSEQSDLALNIDDDRDKAISNFLSDAMKNYHTWLAKKDPLNPNPTQITLTTAALDDDRLADLDAVLILSNQYMANHSKLGPNYVMSGSSNEARRTFTAGRTIYNGNDIIFGGDYRVTGTLNISSVKVPFEGQGKWILSGSELRESLTCTYAVDENGYVVLPDSLSIGYTYFMEQWKSIEFEGLEFKAEDDIDAAEMTKLKDMLGEVYRMFLLEVQQFLQFDAQNLPKQLLREYLVEIFKATKLDDIASKWQSTTTEPTNPPDTEPTPSLGTDSTSPPPSGNGNHIYGSFGLYILTLFAVFLYV